MAQGINDMILLLDIGNSFIKWCWLDDGQLFDVGEVLHADDELARVLDDEWRDLPQPTAVWVSNVAGDELAEALGQWLQQRWGLLPHYATSSEAWGEVRNAYDEPGRLGVDRWLALLAAYEISKQAVCIIDCGTAITVDVMASSGQHLGGLIVPGLGMMRDSLYAGTDGVQKAVAESPASGLLACDTAGAVEGGSLYAAVAFIDRVCADMEKELDEPMTCILTGGDALDILPLLNAELEHEPTLVLQGLALIAESA
jgi:type III pantothenate kinase